MTSRGLALAGGAVTAALLGGAPAAASPDSVPRLRLVALKQDLVHSVTDAAAERVLWRHQTWSVDPRGDSLSVRFSFGLTGIVFAFGLPPGRGARVAAGDTLAGRGTEHWDHGPPFQRVRGRVTAVRVACPAVDSAAAGSGTTARPPTEAL